MSEEAEKIIQTIKQGSLPSLTIQHGIDHTIFGLQSLNKMRKDYLAGEDEED